MAAIWFIWMCELRIVALKSNLYWQCSTLKSNYRLPHWFTKLNLTVIWNQILQKYWKNFHLIHPRFFCEFRWKHYSRFALIQACSRSQEAGFIKWWAKWFDVLNDFFEPHYSNKITASPVIQSGNEMARHHIYRETSLIWI